MEMNKFGITGGIGSGKTYITRLLEQRGFPIFNCDRAAHQLMLEDPALQQELSSLIGAPVITKEGDIDKRVIGEYLFASPEHVQQVNALVHPRVREAFRQWCAGQEQQLSLEAAGGDDRERKPWVGMECSILFESHFDDLVDFIACVYAPENIRLERVAQRDGLPRQVVVQRMKRQLPEAEKLKRADFIFYNDGRSSIALQLEKFESALLTAGGR